MAILSKEKILEYLPSLFETNLKGQVEIFKKLEKILIFDEGFIYFANPDSLQLKYSYIKHSNYPLENVFNLNKTAKDLIFNKNPKILDNEDKIINLLELPNFNQNSYILAKLQIKSIVFGVIVL